MSVTINAMRAVEEEFKQLAIILPEDRIYTKGIILHLNKRPPRSKMLGRILFEMGQNGFVRSAIVDNKEMVCPTEKFIEVLAFAKAYNAYINSGLEVKYKHDSEKFYSFLVDFCYLCSEYCEDWRMEEEHITNPKFSELYKKSLEEYHKKFSK